MSDHLHSEEEKTTEGHVCIMVIKHSAVLPQFQVHLIASNQLQNSVITGSVWGVSSTEIKGWNLKDAILY